MNRSPTFEETYPRYEFAELVRLGIAIARSILWMLRREEAPAPSGTAFHPVSPAQR